MTPDLTQIYSPVAETLLFIIPTFLIFALAFDLIAVHMIILPTINLFRRIQRLPSIT